MITLKGEREVGVFVTPENKTQRLTSVTPDASESIADAIREVACSKCPIYERPCNGVGMVLGNGDVLEAETGKGAFLESA